MEETKVNPVGCTGEGKISKGNIREGKTGTVLELSLDVNRLYLFILVKKAASLKGIKL